MSRNPIEEVAKQRQQLIEQRAKLIATQDKVHEELKNITAQFQRLFEDSSNLLGGISQFYSGSGIKPSDVEKFNSLTKQKMAVIYGDAGRVLGSLKKPDLYNSPFSALTDLARLLMEEKDFGKFNALLEAGDVKSCQSLMTRYIETYVKRVRELTSGNKGLTDTVKNLKKELKEKEDIEAQARSLERRTENISEEVEKLTARVSEKERHIELLKKYFRTAFGPEKRKHIFYQLSEIGLPDIKLEWNDKGIDYVLSSKIDYMTEYRDQDLTKLIDEFKRPEQDKKPLKDIRAREEFQEIIDSLAPYAYESAHSNNLNGLIVKIRKTKNALDVRVRKGGLYWCDDATKNCYFACPGFRQNEKCKWTSSIGAVYNTNRLLLLDFILGETLMTFLQAKGIENRIVDGTFKPNVHY